ncbi:hypothetical protein [Methylobacterium sp. E-046]|uniref:hypothetical protein n=1 Tax=Methylobacterium sp. E-046 TaxID=2836576 RepID=UPI001FBB38A8|nr:hypothetical protein [Methylobacterium sp. E-046]MCJ2098971.1 hypothetical protein [Methylobacterium sp. E-046]
MSDRATQLAQFLCEGGAMFRASADGGIADGELIRVIRGRFPGITKAEIQRGVRIAVEVVLTDGRHA